MTSKLLKLTYAGVVSATILSATIVAAPAYAAGTVAGSSVVNTATVNYNVGSVAQTAVNASDTFIVDRKINLTVAEVGTITTTVSPGQPAAVTSFTVTNTSNETLDFLLTLAQQPNSTTAAHGGSDSFDMTGLSLFRDVNGNGTYESGTDTAITFIDELAADASVTILAVGNVPAGLATGAVAGLTLTATAREGAGVGTQGAAITQTVGANTAAKDTVFADTSGAATGDVARDGSHSDDDDYTVSAAAITVAKVSSVISDPFNGTTNPKMIPGATIEYCIRVSNASGGAAASSVAISDIVPTTLTFIAGSIKLNGTVTGAVCNTDGVAGGSFASGTVSGTIATIASPDTRTLVFRATVN